VKNDENDIHQICSQLTINSTSSNLFENNNINEYEDNDDSDWIRSQRLTSQAPSYSTTVMMTTIEFVHNFYQLEISNINEGEEEKKKIMI